MGRCHKDEPTGKNLVCKNALPISEKNSKNLLGGGGVKLCISNYIHKSIPGAKFNAGSSSSFGDMTSKNFPGKKGTSHQIRLCTPRKRV